MDRFCSALRRIWGAFDRTVVGKEAMVAGDDGRRRSQLTLATEAASFEQFINRAINRDA